MYNGRLYPQVDGVTMGNPLRPKISNYMYSCGCIEYSCPSVCVCLSV